MNSIELFVWKVAFLLKCLLVNSVTGFFDLSPPRRGLLEHYSYKLALIGVAFLALHWHGPSGALLAFLCPLILKTASNVIIVSEAALLSLAAIYTCKWGWLLGALILVAVS